MVTFVIAECMNYKFGKRTVRETIIKKCNQKCLDMGTVLANQEIIIKKCNQKCLDKRNLKKQMKKDVVIMTQTGKLNPGNMHSFFKY